MYIYIKSIMDEHESRVECVAIVLLEMGLSLFGIILNLLIITTLRQDGTLPASMLNCLLLNLCFSNLIISFFVKPISAIYIGYSIFTSQWRISLVFCTLYTVAYQTTWCTFPLTILVLSWFKILSLLRATCQCYKIHGSPWMNHASEDGHKGSHPASTDSLINLYSVVKSFDEDDLLESKLPPRRLKPPPPSVTIKKVKRTVEDGLSLRQKILVFIMWIISLFFGIMVSYPDKVFGIQLISKIRQGQMEAEELPVSNVSEVALEESTMSICVIRSGVNDLIDYISISITLVLPIILGPCCILLVQGILSFCSRFICLLEKTKASPQSKGSQPSWGLLLSLLFIFLLTYPLHLYFSEIYFQDPFIFVIFKYFLGSFFILLIPLSILYWERDIRQGLGSVVDGSLVCQNRKKDEVGRSTPCLLGGGLSPSISGRPRSHKIV